METRVEMLICREKFQKQCGFDPEIALGMNYEEAEL